MDIKKILKYLLGKRFINNFRNFKYINRDVSIGDNVEIKNSRLKKRVGIADNASIKNSYIQEYTSIGRYSKLDRVKIGKYCSISWNVSIGAGKHKFTHLSSHAFYYVKNFGFVERTEIERDYTILGHDVWIGCDAIILEGVEIGNGAIIGAGAVVLNDIPEYSVAAGCPAKIIKTRFTTEIINELKEMQWWNFDDEFIKKNIFLFKNEINLEMVSQLKQLHNEFLLKNH